MSDFRDLIKSSTYTPEQHSAFQRAEELIGQNEEAKNYAVLFCDWLKKHIQERAQKGLYKLSGDTHIIDGYIHHYIDTSTDWPEFKYGDADNIEKVAGVDFAHAPLSTKNKVCEDYCGYWGCGNNSPYVNIHINDFEAGKGRLLFIGRKEHTHRWNKTFKLSQFGKYYINYIKDSLEKDDIQIKHIWIVRKWEDKHPEYSHEHARGKVISNKVITSDKFEVEQSWNDIAGVFSAFKYEFKY